MSTTATIGNPDDFDFSPGRTAAIKFVNRLGQHVDGPGVYPVTLIVKKDGRWQIVLRPRQVEDLG